MNKRWFGIILGAAVAGGIVYALGKFSGKNKGPIKDRGESEAERAEDGALERLAAVVCENCGKQYKEYEFFCPFCRTPAQKN